MEFSAFFWPQILEKNNSDKFWNLDEKSIPTSNQMSPLIKSRTNYSFIIQPLHWLRTEQPLIEYNLHFFAHFGHFWTHFNFELPTHATNKIYAFAFTMSGWYFIIISY